MRTGTRVSSALVSFTCDILQERRFSDARDHIHKGVVEAVNDDLLFEGKRVPVCAGGDVHVSGVPAAVGGRITPGGGGRRDR